MSRKSRLLQSLARRVRIVAFGIAEMRGGPLDGATRRVSRLSPFGLAIPEWGSVLRRADGSLSEFWPWSSIPGFEQTWDADEVWLGVYQFRFAADGFTWSATGARSKSDVYRDDPPSSRSSQGANER